MDYEKNYKDAFGLAKDWYNDATTTEKERRLLAAMFPELKESEDERIRTRLIALVEAFGQGEYKNGMLAYLERQKELAVIPDELVKNYKLFCEQGGRELALLINAINGFNKQKGMEPEVDLEKELREYFEGWRSCTVDIDDVKEITRHFYELGLNARKV